MTRRLVVLGLVLAAAGAAFASAAAPVLRSATQRDGHVSVVLSLPPSSVAVEIEVGVSRATGVNGAFLSGVRLRERLTARGTEPVRRRTRAALPPGRYYVHVASVDLDGVTSCIPRTSSCLEEWSNLLPVVIPSS